MSTREALLDAAFDAVVAGQWARTRMADVARAAGVSRQTLYNEFGSKDALATALALREAECFLVGVHEVMVHAGTEPGEAVGAAALWSLNAAHDNPLVKAALTDDAAGLLPFLTTRSAAILMLFRDDMVAVLPQRWPSLAREEVTWVSEMAVRVTVSHLVVSTEPPETTAGHVATLVRRLLAPPAPG
jgi:AcrR family transcriptional regulator